jgi:stage IV sporulation protein FA
MEVNDKVKQRRVERIRKLQETTNGQPVATISARERPRVDPDWLRKMEDPEFAWRHRMNQEQEKAGRYVDENQRSLLSPPSLKSIWAKLIVSLVIFGLLWGLFQIKQPWAEAGRRFVTISLTQPIDFKQVSAWYTDRFGGPPSFIPSFYDHSDPTAIKVSTDKRTYFIPLQGKIRTPFDAAHPGIMLQTQANAPVYALDTGQVIFAGAKEETGFTVIIRHPGGLQSVYGGLVDSRVEVNDWIKGGEPIGKASQQDQAGSLYFAVSKDGRFINPTDVISFD